MHLVKGVLVAVVGLLVSGIVTGITYGLLWGAIWLTTASLISKPHAGTVAWIFIAVTLVAAVIAIRRRSLRSINELDWDSGTREDAPSRIALWRSGGVFWNVNPLGPRSMSSIASIGAAILCLGPGMAIATIVGALHPPDSRDPSRTETPEP